MPTTTDCEECSRARYEHVSEEWSPDYCRRWLANHPAVCQRPKEALKRRTIDATELAKRVLANVRSPEA